VPSSHIFKQTRGQARTYLVKSSIYNVWRSGNFKFEVANFCFSTANNVQTKTINNTVKTTMIIAALELVELDGIEPTT
jgi:hypothetical protein